MVNEAVQTHLTQFTGAKSELCPDTFHFRLVIEASSKKMHSTPSAGAPAKLALEFLSESLVLLTAPFVGGFRPRINCDLLGQKGQITQPHNFYQLCLSN